VFSVVLLAPNQVIGFGILILNYGHHWLRSGNF
jgi:hypothetical protein